MFVCQRIYVKYKQNILYERDSPMTTLLNLHEKYTALRNCPLIRDNNLTDDTMAEFEFILNSAQPSKDNIEDMAQYNLVKTLYNNNPQSFTAYLRSAGSRVGCLILWTHTKSIINHFNLYGKFHLIWSPETLHYTRTEFIKQEKTQEEQQRRPFTQQQRQPYRNLNRNWRSDQRSEQRSDQRSEHSGGQRLDQRSDQRSDQRAEYESNERRSRYNFNTKQRPSRRTSPRSILQRATRHDVVEPTTSETTSVLDQSLTNVDKTQREQFNGSWAEICSK